MFVDSHCHLFFEDYQNDFEDVLKKANEVGVKSIVVPGTDMETSKEAVSLSEKYDCIFAAVGFHPHDAKKAEGNARDDIEKLSFHEKVVAIGEIGLDYHYDFSPREKQCEVFSAQIEIAQRRNLPIIIHERESREDVLSIIEKKISNGVTWRHKKGVFHCFAGDTTMAKKVIEWGFYISIPGPITFPEKPNKPNSMLDVVKNISMENILLETDSPFLTPVPFRGKRNEPSNIPLIAKKISEIKNISIEEVATQSTNAAKTLFNI